nr:hypothetical protein [Tanacetum cinerariifolium]
MQKRKNDVKERTTLLLALPDEHHLRLCKYDSAKELWEAILKTFGGNEATNKAKKNQLNQQYGNFKAEGSETLEQTFNRLQAIVSYLEFMDVPIEQDDLNQKFFTSLAPEWLVYTIVWRNRDDLDTISLDDVYNHLKVYEPELLSQMDVKSAFLYGTIDEEVYVMEPPGFQDLDQMDVKSAFLYGTIDEEVYVMEPHGFQDLEFPHRFYK